MVKNKTRSGQLGGGNPPSSPPPLPIGASVLPKPIVPGKEKKVGSSPFVLPLIARHAAKDNSVVVRAMVELSCAGFARSCVQCAERDEAGWQVKTPLGKGRKLCHVCGTVVGSPTRVCPHCQAQLPFKTHQ